MKKSKKMLILILAITVVVSAIIVAIFCLNNSDNNSNIKLTIDQKDFDTIKSKTSLSGTIETSDTVEEIIYEGYQNGDVYWSGKAVVNKNNWYIKEVFLVSGENEIVITAKTDKGSTTETINIHYDSGTSYTFDESKVRYDEETGITYVNNILLVIFEDDVTEDEILEIIKPYNGEIAGRGGSIWDIKIDEKSYKELKKISSELEEKDEVFAAMINTADKVVPDTDIRESMVAYKYWEDIGDWGYEAMEVSSVYNYENRFSEIEIGVVDTGFDLDHEDLNGIFTPATENMESENDYKEWNEKQKKEITNSHGTHVAGIIGSIADNKGITGILKKVNIIYSDWLPNETKGKQQWDSASRVLKSLEDSVTKGAKVVNFSLGCSGATEIDNNGFVSVYSSERGSVNFSQTWKDEQAKKACQVMENLLNDNYDFLVVQSSGNGTPVEVARNTIEQIAVDATNNGYWCSVTENNVVASTEKMKHDILNRIIVVGNAKKNSDGTYQQAIDSNGGTRVDICAPGTDIYSTTVDNNYGLLSGTSMAAPQVTGVCGLVWSVNSNFTGAEVKEMVCNYTSITVNDNPDGKHPLNNTYKMVNAKLAVEEAIRRTDIGYGTVTAFVKEKDTDKPLNNVYVTADINGSKYNTITDETGKFELTLPVGTHTLKLTSDNFLSKTLKVIIEKDEDTVLLDTIYLDFNINEASGVVEDKEKVSIINDLDFVITKENVRAFLNGCLNYIEDYNARIGSIYVSHDVDGYEFMKSEIEIKTIGLSEDTVCVNFFPKRNSGSTYLYYVSVGGVHVDSKLDSKYFSRQVIIEALEKHLSQDSLYKGYIELNDNRSNSEFNGFYLLSNGKYRCNVGIYYSPWNNHYTYTIRKHTKNDTNDISNSNETKTTVAETTTSPMVNAKTRFSHNNATMNVWTKGEKITYKEGETKIMTATAALNDCVIHDTLMLSDARVDFEKMKKNASCVELNYNKDMVARFTGTNVTYDQVIVATSGDKALNTIFFLKDGAVVGSPIKATAGKGRNTLSENLSMAVEVVVLENSTP